MQLSTITFYLLLIINLACPLNLFSQKAVSTKDTNTKKDGNLPKKQIAVAKKNSPGSVIEVKTAAEVDQYLPAVLEFYSDDCGACKRFKEHFEKLAQKYPAISFLRINAIKNPDLTQTYKIMSLPSFVFIVNSATKNPKIIVGPKKRDVENAVKELITQSNSSMQTAKSNVQNLSSLPEFEKLVREANKLIVAEYHAEKWCGHCKIFAPKFLELADEHGDVAIFVKLDDMESNNKAFGQKYKVSGLPTTFIFKAGDLSKPLAIIEGADKDQLHTAICKAANKPETKNTQASHSDIIIEIFGQAQFDDLINKSTVPVIVDYHAESWCGACKMYKELFANLAKTFPKLKFVKIDGNLNQNKAIGDIYKIKSLPTTLIFENGKNTNQIIGIDPKLQAILDELNKKTN